jgi:hypothetical protein
MTFWRWFAPAALAAILLLSTAVFAALGGFRVWYSDLRYWDTYGRHAENVHLNLSTNRVRCTDPDYGIELDIVNSSERTVESIHFRLSARKPGHSTDLVESTSNSLFNDNHIIEPGSRIDLCLRVPGIERKIDKPLENLEWTTEKKHVWFRA